MASSNFGLRDALNELARGQEVKERLRSLLRRSPVGVGGGGVEIPCAVSGELRPSSAAGAAIVGDNESKASAAVAAPAMHGGGEIGETSAAGSRSIGREKKRKKSQSRTYDSCAPYDDGFQWRKYGEKKISKSKFTRSYFKCSYRDEEGCMATKQVQQKEMEDPPMFLVTYLNDHTCSCRDSLFLTDEGL